MNKKIKLYIHLGFPKAASTYIQKFYFSKIPNTKYINKEKDLNLKKLSQRILFYPVYKFKTKNKEINNIVN